MRQADYSSIPANKIILEYFTFNSQRLYLAIYNLHVRGYLLSRPNTILLRASSFSENWLALGISRNDDVLTSFWNSN